MKRGRVVVLAIAFASALAAALIARHVMSRRPSVRTVEKTVNATEVLVAARGINLGDAIGGSDLKWQVWPKSGVTSSLITKQNDPHAESQILGSIARAPFVAGEPINGQKLIRPKQGGVLAAILPEGMRAVSTPINNDNAVSGFVLPNDRVDVILTRRVEIGGKQQQTSSTVLRDIRVLAIGQTIETHGNEKTASGSTATLELTPHQVETLELARSMGSISLSLRSLADSERKANEPSAASLDNSDSGSVRVLKYAVPTRVFGVN